MDLEGITLSEVSQRQRLYGIAYIWNEKNKMLSTEELVLLNYSVCVGEDS